MDPVSLIGLIAASEQLVKSTYEYTTGVFGAKKEINSLRSESLALKAALEHVRLNNEIDLQTNDGSFIQVTAISGSAEFKDMLLFTKSTLSELQTKLDNHQQSRTQRLVWPLMKDEANYYIGRLERAKSWFILVTTSDNFAICRQAYNEILSMSQQLHRQEQRQIQKHNDALRRKVRAWIAPHDPNHLYDRALKAHRSGTCDWFLKGDFRKLLQAKEPSALWLLAKPGMGKTTVLSATVRTAQLFYKEQPQKCGLAYFFCSFTEKASQDPINVLGSILSQICDSDERLWAVIENRYQNEAAQLKPSVSKLDKEELYSFIYDCTSQLDETIIILDAVNESGQWQRILHSIDHILRGEGNIKLLISSTENINVNLGLSMFIVHMTREKTASDMEYYIDTWIKNSDELSSLPPKLQRDILFELQTRAKGSFRWAQCQLQDLATKQTVREIRQALVNVPETLEQTYEAILSRIPKGDQWLARQTLFWICFSLEPMLFEELSEAVIVGEDSVVVVDDEARLIQPRRLLDMCGSLISYSRSTTQVVFAHSSVPQYLTSRSLQNGPMNYFFLDETSADAQITTRCLNYLMLPAFSSGYCTNEQKLGRRFEDWPLLRYISDTLFEHLTYVKLDEHLQKLLLRFFSTRELVHSGNFGAWVQGFYPAGVQKIESSTPLYYASRFGLLDIVKLILAEEGTKNLEQPGGVHSSTPLVVATWAGRTEVVRELLARGANADAFDDGGIPALAWALKHGYQEIERMLRDAGASIEGDLFLRRTLELGGFVPKGEVVVDSRPPHPPLSEQQPSTARKTSL